MINKDKKVFMRAKPQEIAIEERYYYHTDIGDNTKVEFQRAEGEVRLNYPYDGKEFFDENAIKDLEGQYQSDGPLQATVGHLNLHGHLSTSWAQALKQNALSIVLPVDDTKSKVECSQMCVLRYKYEIEEPASPPALVDAALIDEEQFLMSRTSFEDRMRLNLLIDARLAEVRNRAEEALEEPVLWLLDQGEGEEISLFPPDPRTDELAKTIAAMANSRGGYIIIGKTQNGHESSLTDDELYNARATLQDAVMACSPPVPILIPRFVVVGEISVLLSRVPPDLSDVYQFNGAYWRRSGTTNLQLSEKEVIKLRSQRPGSKPIDQARGEGISTEEISPLLARVPGPSLSFVSEEKDMTSERLAETVVAMANSQGGYILIGVRAQPEGGTTQILGITEPKANEIISRISNVATECVPPVPIFGPRLLIVEGKNVVVVRIAGGLPYVYSVAGHILTRLEAHNESMPADAIYKQLVERSGTKVRELSADVQPVVTYIRLDWPYIAYGVTAPARFDPEKKALEWHHLDLQLEGEDHYQCTVSIPIEQPKKLYQNREIKGEIRLLFQDVTLSGLSADYFNALGEGRRPLRALLGSLPKLELSSGARSTQPARVKIERSTIIVMDIAIALDSVFQRRKFFPYRHIELEGIIPEPHRLSDILNVLNDLGIRVEIRPDPATSNEAFLNQMERGFLISGIKRAGAEELAISLVVKGFKSGLTRQVELGRRKDTLRLNTGRLAIDIFGSVQGDFTQLSSLLSEIQTILKERLEFVRVT